MMPANKQQNHERRRVGLVLALVVLISAASLATGPIRESSAQADAPSWSYTGSLNEARYFQTATLLSDGKVLVVGASYVGLVLASAELYDPDMGKWNATSSLNVPRTRHTATLLKDGKVLIVGGLTEVLKATSTARSCTTRRMKDGASPAASTRRALNTRQLCLRTARCWSWEGAR